MKRLVNIERERIKTINRNLNAALKKLKKVKLNSANHREEHLRQQAEEYELLDNLLLVRYLRNLITIEQQKEVHHHIGRFTKNKKSSKIKYIDIPIDTTIPFDKIPKPFPTKTGVDSINQKTSTSA